jgi:GxxExxY protein
MSGAMHERNAEAQGHGGAEDCMSKLDGDQALSGHVVDAAICVHRALGPGMLESSYEMCLAYELRTRGLDVLTQVPVPVSYRGVDLGIGYRMDMLAAGELVVELKTVVKLMPVHDAQLLSYLRLSGRRVGLLINFHVSRLKDGIHRIVNGA